MLCEYCFHGLRRRNGEGPPGYSPGVGKFDSDIFRGLDNLYPGVAATASAESQ